MNITSSCLTLRYFTFIVIRAALLGMEAAGAHTRFTALCLLLTAMMSTDSETLWHCLSGTAHSKKFGKLQMCLCLCLRYSNHKKCVYERGMVIVSVLTVIGFRFLNCLSVCCDLY